MIIVTVTATDEDTGETRTWENEIDKDDDNYVELFTEGFRSEGDSLLSAAIVALHRYDILAEPRTEEI